MQKKTLYIILTMFIVFMSGCSSLHSDDNNKTTLTISAAASLKESLEDIKQAYETANPNVSIRFNFGGSGSLQQQISQGAPVDLFFSAAEDKFLPLVEADLIATEDYTSFLGNELVLIVSTENPYQITSFEDLNQPDIDHISIGTPETVPAGKYAKQSLENQLLWDKLESKMVYAKDVRQVLSYVETGNVAAGIVYKTDAILSDKVTIVTSADPVTHSPIRYPIGIIKDTAHYDIALNFYHYLQTEETLEVFKNYGFTIN